MPVPEPIHLPADAWRAPAVTRMLAARDFRAIFTLARRHQVSPARIAASAGLDEDLIRKVMTGDTVLTEPAHIEAIATALSLPAPARAALGLGPRPGDLLHLPPEFWAQPDITRALAAWDVPAMLAAILDERRWTQQQLADILGYSQSWVSNVLRRDQSLSLDQARDIVLLFGAPLHQLTLTPEEPPGDDHRPWAMRNQAGTPDSGQGHVRPHRAVPVPSADLMITKDPTPVTLCRAAPIPGEIAFVLGSDLPGSSKAALASFSRLIGLAQQPAPSLREREAFYEGLVQVLAAWADTMKRRELLQTLGWAATTAAASPIFPGLSLDEQERVVHVLGGRHRIDDEAIGHVESVLFAAMRLDDALGPQAALGTVLAQRNLVRALLLDCPAALRPRLLSLYSNMSRFVGLLCFDLKDFDSATYFFEQARVTAHEAENTELGILTLCNLSQMATWRSQPRVGIDHAVAAVAWAKRTGDQLLSAFVAHNSARAYAGLGDQRATLAELDAIPAMLDGAGEQSQVTSLAYWYGPGMYACNRAGCLLVLRDALGALAAAQQAIALIGPAFVRAQGFGLLNLGNAYIQSKEIDEAARIIGDAAGLAAQNRSARLVDALMQSRQHLDPWRQTTAVRDLDEQLVR